MYLRRIKWSTCALSGQRLEHSVVADYLGNLYNKEAVLKFLLNRKGIFESEAERYFYMNVLRTHDGRFDHLNKRRDVFELKTGTGEFGSSVTCPVSGLNCFSTPFSAIAVCGHVFSDRAINEMKDRHCMECSASFQVADVIPLNRETELLIGKQRDNRKKRIKDEPAIPKKRIKSSKTKHTNKDNTKALKRAPTDQN